MSEKLNGTLKKRMWCPYCASTQNWELNQKEGTPARYVCQGCLKRIQENKQK